MLLNCEGVLSYSELYNTALQNHQENLTAQEQNLLVSPSHGDHEKTNDILLTHSNKNYSPQASRNWERSYNLYISYDNESISA